MLGDAPGLRIADVAAALVVTLSASRMLAPRSPHSISHEGCSEGAHQASRRSRFVRDRRLRSTAAVARWHFRTRRVRAARRPRPFSRFARERVGAHLLPRWLHHFHYRVSDHASARRARRFNDPESRGKVYPKSYDHTISAFVMAAEHAGLRFD